MKIGGQMALKRLGEIQAKHPVIVFFAAAAFTLFMLLGMTNIRIQTDLSKEMPEHLPVIELQKDVSEKFGGYDPVLVVVRLDENAQVRNRVEDIRDPRVLRMVRSLASLLSKENKIGSVISVSPVISSRGIPSTLKESKSLLGGIPGAGRFFNKDYTATLILAYASVGAKESEVKDLTRSINEDITSVEKPAGIQVDLGGMPMMRMTLLELLVHDSKYTISLAAAIILAMLLLLYGFTRGFLIFLPLALGLIWTLGTMGWLNIPLSIGTVGIGPLILGLGVEYGVFVVKMYEEARGAGKSQLDTLTSIIPGVGLAITGAASTTIIGFLALLAASMPMIQNMGLTLAIGIFYCFLAGVAVNPSLIVLVENLQKRRRSSAQG